MVQLWYDHRCNCGTSTGATMMQLWCKCGCRDDVIVSSRSTNVTSKGATMCVLSTSQLFEQLSNRDMLVQTPFPRHNKRHLHSRWSHNHTLKPEMIKNKRYPKTDNISDISETIMRKQIQ